jgi:hypothetical protein
MQSSHGNRLAGNTSHTIAPAKNKLVKACGHKFLNEEGYHRTPCKPMHPYKSKGGRINLSLSTSYNSDAFHPSGALHGIVYSKQQMISYQETILFASPPTSRETIFRSVKNKKGTDEERKG